MLIRRFNDTLRTSVSGAALTIISALAGLSAARGQLSDSTIAVTSACLVISLGSLHMAMIHQLRTWHIHFLVCVSAIGTWIFLTVLTSLPLTGLGLIAAWIGVSYLLQFGPKSEKLDDEIAELLEKKSLLQTQRIVLEAVVPVSRKLDELTQELSQLTKSKVEQSTDD